MGFVRVVLFCFVLSGTEIRESVYSVNIFCLPANYWDYVRRQDTSPVLSELAQTPEQYNGIIPMCVDMTVCSHTQANKYLVPWYLVAWLKVEAHM